MSCIPRLSSLSNKPGTRYVNDILRSTSSDVEQVIVEPDGRWSTPKNGENAPTADKGGSTHDDDELIEVTGPPNGIVKQERPTASPAFPREASTLSPAQSASRKRSAPHDVVDLTLSSDDDEPLLRPHKRRSVNGLGRNLVWEEPSHGGSFGNGTYNLPYLNQSSSTTPSRPGGYNF